MKCKWGSCLEKELLMRFLYCNRCKEKYEIAGRNLCIVFVDLQKHDYVHREAIWWALRREGVMEKEVLAITEMYKYIIALVRINSEKSKNKAEIRVH